MLTECFFFLKIVQFAVFQLDEAMNFNNNFYFKLQLHVDTYQNF